MKKCIVRDQRELEKIIVKHLTRVLEMVMCDLDPKSPTMKVEIEKRIHNERRLKSKQEAVEQFFNELNIKYWNFFTEQSGCNNQSFHQTVSKHNMKKEVDRNERCCSSCLGCEKRRLTGNTIHDVKDNHNRKPIENNDEIVIRIPRVLKISSIQIQFDSNNSLPVGQSLSDRF